MFPNLLYGKAIGVTSGVFVRRIGADAWTSMLIGFAIGTLVVLATAFLCSKFPEKTILQIAEELLGKWVGRGIGLVLAAFFLVAYAVSADVLALHLSDYFLTETPMLAICVIYGLVILYGAWLGFEVVVRLSLIGLIMLVLLNVTMITGVLKDFSFMNLQPVLDRGLPENTATSVYLFSDLSMAILAAGMFYPSLNIKKKAVSISALAMAVSTVLIVIWPFMETGVLGPEIMRKYIVVCMEQIRCAQFTKYLPRFELLMVSFYVFTITVQSAAMLHSANRSVMQVTGIKKNWIILLPLTAAAVILSYLLVQDHNRYVEFLTWPWPQICALLGVGLPAVLLITALLKGKLKKAPETKNPGPQTRPG